MEIAPRGWLAPDWTKEWFVAIATLPNIYIAIIDGRGTRLGCLQHRGESGLFNEIVTSDNQTREMMSCDCRRLMVCRGIELAFVIHSHYDLADEACCF